MSEIVNSCLYQTRIKLIHGRIRLIYFRAYSPSNHKIINDYLFDEAFLTLRKLYEKLGFASDKNIWITSCSFLKKYEKEALDEDYIKSFELITQTMEQIVRYYESSN